MHDDGRSPADGAARRAWPRRAGRAWTRAAHPRRAAFTPVATLGAVLCLALVSLPEVAAAQCAVCGNPAFLTGDNDHGQLWLRPAPDRVGVRVALLYTSQRYTDLYSGADKVPQSSKASYMFTPDWALHTQVASLVLGVQLPSGTELALTAPFVRASATRPPDQGPGTGTDSAGNPIATTADSGVADVALRLRQWLPRALARRVGVESVWSVGAVAPTGAFIAKDPEGSVPDTYASLGRGVWWVTLDAELSSRREGGLGRLTGGVVGWAAGVFSRLPVGSIANNGFLFRWGPELRAYGHLKAALLGGALGFTLGAEWLARAQGEERIFADAPLGDFPNGGGRWLTLVPTAQVAVGAGISVNAAARVQLWRRVHGIQPVPGYGLTLGLTWQR